MKTGKSKETLFAEERQAQILKTLKAEHKVFVLEKRLCRKDYTFDYAKLPSRALYKYQKAFCKHDRQRYSEFLERAEQEKGLLKRTHGGAVLKSKIGYEENVAEKLSKNQRQKEKIAELAVNYVEDGDIIALDTGTTMLAFAKKLTEKKNLTIVTNDLNIAAYFDSNKEDITVILLGGVLRKKHGCTLGGMTFNGLEGLRVDKCFLATNGLTAEFGLSTPDMNHAEVKKKLAGIGEQTILLCDSDKIGRNVFVKIMDVTKIDILITDSGIDETEAQKLEELGVEIKTVSMEEAHDE